MRRPINLAGTKFGRLTAIEFVGNKRWKCICDCGIETRTTSQNLRSGKAQSCGCRQREICAAKTKMAKTTHGKTAGGASRVYRIWTNMLSRCYNPKASAFDRYGGRGITVCDEWRSFENFYFDMGEPPAGMTLDRKNNAEGYSKENCRWITHIEQCNNRRSNIIVTINGVSMSATQWSREPGAANAKKIRRRIEKGWTHFDAVFSSAKFKPSNDEYTQRIADHFAMHGVQFDDILSEHK